MTLRIPPKSECYSNTCHHAASDKEPELTEAQQGLEALDAFYLADLQMEEQAVKGRVDKEEIALAEGGRLLKVRKPAVQP